MPSGQSSGTAAVSTSTCGWPSRRRAARSTRRGARVEGEQRVAPAGEVLGERPVEQPTSTPRRKRCAREHRQHEVALAPLVPPAVDAPRVRLRRRAGRRGPRRRSAAPRTPRTAPRSAPGTPAPAAPRRRPRPRAARTWVRCAATAARLAEPSGSTAGRASRPGRRPGPRGGRRASPSARTRRGTPAAARRCAPPRSRPRGPTASWSGWPSPRQGATSRVPRPSPTSSTRA